MKSKSSEMPFLDHLEELRWRLIWSIGAILLGLMAGFLLVVRFKLIKLLQEPIAPYLAGGRLFVTGPADSFSITMTVSVAVGLVLAAPVVIYQVWLFLSPALHRHERKIAIPVLAGAVFLFLCGVGLAWFFVIPMLLNFLMTWQEDVFQPMITATGYISFIVSLVLTFGLTFELPLLVIALSALGIVTPPMLTKFRPYALALSFAGSAFVTPGDILLATIALAVPLYLLYEVSLVLTRIIFRKKRRTEAAPVESSPDDYARG